MAPIPANRSAEARRRGAAAGLLAIMLAAVLIQQRRLARLRRLATTDPLTGLANRRGLKRAWRPGSALLFIDLDGFKAVNDRLGHGAGDRLLVTVAARLASVGGRGVCVARWGGDEFAAVVPADQAGALAAAMRDAVSRPFAMADGPARIGLSIGIGGGADLGAALDAASAALGRTRAARRRPADDA
jgi:diguanylate cyclase (GGDEF)-like protein